MGVKITKSISPAPLGPKWRMRLKPPQVILSFLKKILYILTSNSQTTGMIVKSVDISIISVMRWGGLGCFYSENALILSKFSHLLLVFCQ